MRVQARSHVDTYCFAVQTSHFTPAQAGEIFNLTKPRLAVIHHATVNDASREALVSDVSTATAHLAVRCIPDLTFKLHKLQPSHSMKQAYSAFANF